MTKTGLTDKQKNLREKCFAYDYIGYHSCKALNVKRCEYPNCRFFKTKKDCHEEQIRCDQRLQELYGDDWCPNYDEFKEKLHK